MFDDAQYRAFLEEYQLKLISRENNLWSHYDVAFLSEVSFLFHVDFVQVRSLASESERTFLAGPPMESFSERGFDSAASDSESEDLAREMDERESNSGESMRQDAAHRPSTFPSRLDWFAVDFKDELSAMDPGVANRHVAFVVTAINQVRNSEAV